MLRDLLRHLASRLVSSLSLRAARKYGPEDRCRIVPEPYLCFQFEALTEEGRMAFFLEAMIEPSPQSEPVIEALPRVPPHVARIERGCVLGLSFIPVTGNGNTCLRFFTHNPENLNNIRNAEDGDVFRMSGPDLIQHQFKEADDYDTGVLIGNHANFGHWLLNHLARLALAESVPGLNGVPLVVGENITRTQLECLERLGFPASKLIRLRKGRLARFRTLWAPMMPLCGVNGLLYWAPGAVDFLRQRLGIRSTPNAAPRRRLYVTRRASRWRRVLNEDALLERLARWNFEVVDPGELSISQQIAIAADAEIILGAFGAGMNLLFFAPSDARIVEMKYQSTYMDINPLICRRIGQHYASVRVTPTVAGNNPMNYDFAAAPGDVERVLEEMELQDSGSGTPGMRDCGLDRPRHTTGE